MVTWQGRHNIPIFQLKKISSNTEVAGGRARVLTPGPPDSRAQAYSVFRIFSYGTTESSAPSRGGGRAECEGASELWADRIAEAKMRALCGIGCGFRWPGLFRALMWQAVLSDTIWLPVYGQATDCFKCHLPGHCEEQLTDKYSSLQTLKMLFQVTYVSSFNVFCSRSLFQAQTNQQTPRMTRPLGYDDTS